MNSAPSPSNDISQFISTSSGHGSFVISFSMMYLSFISLYALCRFFIRRFRSQNQRQGDIEVGLPPSSRWQQHHASSDCQGGDVQLIIIAQDKDERALREVSWTDFKDDSIEEDITNVTTDCAICLEEFKNADECRVRSKCNHIYHKSCIDEWLAMNKQCCPLCRGYVPVKIFVRSKKG